MTPEELLVKNPRIAIYEMGQEYLDQNFTKLNVKWYRISDPISLGTTLTEVIFTLDRSLTPASKWSELQAFRIRYHRLSLDRVVKASDVIHVTFPAKHLEILRAAVGRYHIPVDSNEVGDETTAGPGLVSLSVSDKSFRWVGVSTCIVKGSTRYIGELIAVNSIVTNYSPNYSSHNVRRDIVRHLNNYNRSKLLPEITFEHIQICCPISLEGSLDEVNTKVKIIANEGMYDGEGYIYYKRRHFTHTWRLPIEIKYNGDSSFYSYIDEINELLGSSLTVSDFENVFVEAPWRKNRTYSIVTFKQESMGFVGELKVMFYDRY